MDSLNRCYFKAFGNVYHVYVKRQNLKGLLDLLDQHENFFIKSNDTERMSQFRYLRIINNGMLKNFDHTEENYKKGNELLKKSILKNPEKDHTEIKNYRYYIFNYFDTTTYSETMSLKLTPYLMSWRTSFLISQVL